MSESVVSDIERLHDRRWWTLAVLCLSLVIVFVGNSSLNVALPTLARDLDATESQLQWVVAAYSLVFAGLLFSTGALGDRFGRKGTLQIGLVLFLVSAAFASASTEMWELIGCRAVMGAAAAMIMPSTLSILINVFPPHERTKAIAIWASITGAAGGFGPVISGWLLGHFWFGAVFLINVPIVAVALISGRFLVPRSRDPQEARLDPVGAVLSIIGIVALVYGIIEAPGKGWTSTPTLVAFGIAAVVLTVFAVLGTAHRRADAGHAPVQEPGVQHRHRRHDARVPRPLRRDVPGDPVLPARAGLQPAVGRRPPAAHGDDAAGRLAHHAEDRGPLRRPSHRGGGHAQPGLRPAAAQPGSAPTPPYWYIILCFLPFAGGMALAMSPMTASIMSAVPARRAGMGSAMNDATRELGAALGVAALGSIAVSRYSSEITSAVSGLGGADRSAATGSIAGALDVASRLNETGRTALIDASHHAFLSGMHLAVLIGAALACISAGIVFRYLPHSLQPEGAMHGPLESFEDSAELGLGGVPPAFADGN